MLFKLILPFENYVLKTKLPEDEVLRRINDNIQEKKPFSFSIFKDDYTKPYTGQIIGNTFEMRRNINYNNSMLPNIYGHVTSFFELTKVTIKMRPNITFLIIKLTGLVFLGLFLIIIIFSTTSILKRHFPIQLIIPIIFLALIYFFTYLSFKIESKKSKKFLANILESIDD